MCRADSKGKRFRSLLTVTNKLSCHCIVRRTWALGLAWVDVLHLCMIFEAEHSLSTYFVTAVHYATAEVETDNTKGGAVMAEKGNKVERIYAR